MKKILVLIDFTKTAYIALEQAISIASENQSMITLCHIAKSSRQKAQAPILENIKPYQELVENYDVPHEILISFGKLFSEVTTIVDRANSDLVVIGTHGIRGLRQTLFGADIYKLIKGIKTATLVVNAKTQIVDGGYKKVILPVAPHEDYLVKVRQTCQLISKEGRVVIFAILKPGLPLSEAILKNIATTKTLLDELGVAWEYQEVDSQIYSVGFARETLQHSEIQKADLISIMTNTSMHNEFFGKMDKETVLVNDKGLAVLCANC